MPASSMALILSDALPLPPEMIAPAWPMRRPGGAVWPAMKPTTGFFTFALMYAAAVSSALPPISPIMMMACVSGIFVEQLERIEEVGADDRIAADADAGGLPDAELRQLADRFVGQRAGARDHADVALQVNVTPGMMPILHLPGEMTPGQFGPISRVLRALQELPGLHHVERRNAFGDADHQRHARVGRFHDRVGRERRRHEDHASRSRRSPSPPARRCRTPAGPDACCRPCRASRRPPPWCRRRSPAGRGTCLPCR